MPNKDHQYHLLELLVDKIMNRGPPKSSLGNPGPLGLAAFAMTTFMLSCWNTGLLNVGTIKIVLPVALWYGGIAQLLAGMWEFVSNNTFGAVAFTSYGAFWLSFATIEEFWTPTNASVTDVNIALGIYLLSWTIFTFYMMIGSFRMSLSLVFVFLLLELTFILLTVGAWSGVRGITAAGGWIGIVTAVTAWYASMAVVINQTYGTQLLPVGVIGPMKREPLFISKLRDVRHSIRERFSRTNQDSEFNVHNITDQQEVAAV
jgi:succinate-acetate transporter protein